MRAAVVVVAAVTASGCFSPSFRDCELRCSAAGACPDGFVCSAGMCRAEGMTGACDVVPPGDGGPADDALPPPDVAPPGAWSAPLLVPGFTGCRAPAVRPDELEIFLVCGGDLMTARRADTNAAWGALTLVPGWVDSGTSASTFLTFDARTLYFASNRSGQSIDIWRMTRADLDATWMGLTRETQLSADNSEDTGGSTNLDHTEIIIVSDRHVLGRPQLLSARRGGLGAAWSTPLRIDELESATFASFHPALSADGLTIVFASTRGGAGLDLYMATRPSPSSSWTTPLPLVGVNEPSAADTEAWLSPDARVLYFVSTRNEPGNITGLYRSTR